MSIELKSPAEIAVIREACLVVVEVLDLLEEAVQVGMSTFDLDALARERCLALGAQPAFLGLYGFPASLCISLNEEVVHGIPSRRRVLQDGDLVSCDFGAKLGEFYGDAARTYLVGAASDEARRLVTATEESLELAIAQCQPGNRLGDIGAAVQRHVESRGFAVVRDFVGHGIGRLPHEDPQVKNYGLPRRGKRLEEGLVICIEPMVNAGTWEVQVLEDEWTVVTRDRRLSAHFEHTVAVTASGPEVLTRRPGASSPTPAAG